MVTILKNVKTKVVLSLPKAQNNDTIQAVFNSPSRPTISLQKALTSEGGGFFSFEITVAEASDFIDNSYTYKIDLNGEIIALGNVRLDTGQLEGIEYEIEHRIN